MTSLSACGHLYVCATPIGNLSDASPRLVETLQNVAYIAAEDTRVTKKLCEQFNLKADMISVHQHNELSRVALIRGYLQSGKSVAMVSDAGTPNISDPGALLVESLAKEGFSVVPIAGPSALTTLLSISGMRCDAFHFAGFFPKKDSEALQALEKWRPLQTPVVCFETSLRLIKTLNWLNLTGQVASMVLAKELTKHYETVYRGTISEILTQIGEKSLKGEWCFAIKLKEPQGPDPAVLAHLVQDLYSQGLTNRQILHVTKLLKHPKNTVYDLLRHD